MTGGKLKQTTITTDMKSASQTLTGLTSVTCLTVSAGQRLTTEGKLLRGLSQSVVLFLEMTENKQCGWYKVQRGSVLFNKKVKLKKVLKAVTHS